MERSNQIQIEQAFNNYLELILPTIALYGDYVKLLSTRALVLDQVEVDFKPPTRIATWKPYALEEIMFTQDGHIVWARLQEYELNPNHIRQDHVWTKYSSIKELAIIRKIQPKYLNYVKSIKTYVNYRLRSSSLLQESTSELKKLTEIVKNASE